MLPILVFIALYITQLDEGEGDQIHGAYINKYAVSSFI
jgi:hypothetical protein